MTNSRRLAEARDRLCEWLEKRCGEAANEGIIGESILMVDDFYCGRRFATESYYANWFMEEDELKIHAATGDLLCVYAGQEIRFQQELDDRADVISISVHQADDQQSDDQADQANDDDIRRAA